MVVVVWLGSRVLSVAWLFCEQATHTRGCVLPHCVFWAAVHVLGCVVWFGALSHQLAVVAAAAGPSWLVLSLWLLRGETPPFSGAMYVFSPPLLLIGWPFGFWS